MSAYYNEIDKYAAAWLRNLIAAGHIAPGDVDDRSITEVQPDDLRGYDQCHFFAGIGGWSYALRLAGWPDDRPVWTGSCPCQPFSAAGKQRGSDDERHLWPAFFRLIAERRPERVFGEQVAGASGYAWLDHVAADLEVQGYAAAAVDIGAHSVGAPHIRQRLYWMAHAGGGRLSERGERDCESQQSGQSAPRRDDVGGRGILGNSSGKRFQDSESEILLGSWWREEGRATSQPGRSPWADVELLACSDGKARPTQPGLFTLAHGVSNRVGRLRAYGNAIVPQVAATFIQASSRTA